MQILPGFDYEPLLDAPSALFSKEIREGEGGADDSRTDDRSARRQRSTVQSPLRADVV